MMLHFKRQREEGGVVFAIHSQNLPNNRELFNALKAAP